MHLAASSWRVWARSSTDSHPRIAGATSITASTMLPSSALAKRSSSESVRQQSRKLYMMESMRRYLTTVKNEPDMLSSTPLWKERKRSFRKPVQKLNSSYTIIKIIPRERILYTLLHSGRVSMDGASSRNPSSTGVLKIWAHTTPKQNPISMGICLKNPFL